MKNLEKQKGKSDLEMLQDTWQKSNSIPARQIIINK